MTEPRIVQTSTEGTLLQAGDHQFSVPLVGLDGRIGVDIDANELLRLAQSGTTSWHTMASDWALIHCTRGLGAGVWVDYAQEISGDQLIASIKRLRQAIEDRGRILVVASDLRVRPSDDYDTIGALAAAIIRLRVDQFVGVGLGVKALSTQVGLEGSWDGESLWWELPADAYDYLRAWPSPEDVILVSGFPSSEMRTVLDLIEATSR